MREATNEAPDVQHHGDYLFESQTEKGPEVD
jgi:hypothetical protein